MNTNKKFAYYALEDFEGNAQQAGILLYDKGEEIPAVDLENPDVIVEVKFTGDLDSPYDRAIFDKCLSSFGLSSEVIADALNEDTHGVLCQSSCDTPLTYDRDDAVFEALASATEDNVFTKIGDAAKAAGKAVGGIFSQKQRSENQVISNQKKFSDVSQLFQENELEIKDAVTSSKKIESRIQPAVAARYYLDELPNNGEGFKLFVCFEEESKKLRQRAMADVSSGLPAESIQNLIALSSAVTDTDKKKYQDLYTKLATQIVQNIKNATKGKDISGYTTDQTVAQKFKESLSTTEDKGITAELKKLDKEGKYQELSEIWKKKLPSERKVMLDQLLEGDMGKIPQAVRTLLLSLAQPPFGRLSWDIVKHHLASSSAQPLNPTVFKTILQNSTLQTILKNNGLKGLDFGSETQIAVILKAVSVESYSDTAKSTLWKLHSGNKKEWLSAEKMAPIYEQLLKKEAEKSKEGKGTKKGAKKDEPKKDDATSGAKADDAVNKFFDLMKAGKLNLTPDQKAELLKKIYNAK